MAGKAKTFFLVPLCRGCHNKIHRSSGDLVALKEQVRWLERTLEMAFQQGVIQWEQKSSK